MGGSCSHREKTINEKPKIDPKLQPFSAGRVQDYSKNQIKEVKITEDFSVLISEFDGVYYAYGSKCPHYGAPLKDGVLMEGLIRCPWHGASFDIRTGEIEDYPGMYCIPTYSVGISVFGDMKVYPSNIGVYQIERPLRSIRESDQLTIIIGAGASGLTAAQTLREIGYVGRVLMISKDSYLPYDRTKLSKVPGITWEEAKLRDEAWFKTAQIEIMLNATVNALDVEEQQVFIDGMSEPLEYQKLLLASGMKPRVPKPVKHTGVIGSDLGNVLSLYDLRDSRKIKDKCKGKTVVIAGAGFIAMELIEPLSAIAKKIYIVHPNDRPYGISLGPTIGRLIQQMVIRKYKKQVVFMPSDTIRRIYGSKTVSRVMTMKKRKIKCEVVIFAMGSVPNTEFIMSYKDELENDGFKLPPGRGLGMNNYGKIPVNEFMETHLIDHYACGDVVDFPSRYCIAPTCHIAHWGMAQKMGRAAALKIAGREESVFNSVPFFWTTVAGLTIRYVGYGEHYNHSIIFGDLKSLKFCVLYKRGWKILAAITCNCDPIAARLAFDIQDNVFYLEDKLPPYITEVFKARPILGERIRGFKYLKEADIEHFDFVSYKTQRKHPRLPKRMKTYEDPKNKDVEHVSEPLMSWCERMYYTDVRFPAFVSTRDFSMEYDPVRINFYRLQLYKDSRLQFIKDFIMMKNQSTAPPLLWE